MISVSRRNGKLLLSKNEGRQKVDLTLPKEKTKFAPEKLREDAEAYLAKMLELNPSQPIQGAGRENAGGTESG
jgi:hypothetical protein